MGRSEGETAAVAGAALESARPPPATSWLAAVVALEAAPLRPCNSVTSSSSSSSCWTNAVSDIAESTAVHLVQLVPHSVSVMSDTSPPDIEALPLRPQSVPDVTIVSEFPISDSFRFVNFIMSVKAFPMTY